MSNSPAGNQPSWRELLGTFLRIGINSFGGPAGQIGVMHKVLVDEKRWIDDQRFTHALNVCMLLPGPEATQLVTYVGWLLKGTRGGLAAGLLFILPGAAVMLAISALVVAGGRFGLVMWLLIGLQAAAVAFVVEAVVRLARRVLTTTLSRAIAASALLASLVQTPFPLIVLGALLVGWVATRRGVFAVTDVGPFDDQSANRARVPSWSRSLVVLLAGLILWLGPLAAVMLTLGPRHVFSQLAMLNVKAAVMSFGGAYAAIAYVAGEALHTFRWIDGSTLATGLSLAETTPGPLILVLQFIGYAAAHAGAGTEASSPGMQGVLGSVIVLWATFAPCFLWIMLIAPHMEALRSRGPLNAVLAAVSAAVVGVVANFGVVLALAAFFREHDQLHLGWARINVPVWRNVRITGVVIAALALLALMKLKWGVGRVVLLSALIGALMHVAEWALTADANWAD